MPQVRPVRSRSDVFQLFDTMKRNREKRTRRKLFFLEGVHPIEQAVAAGLSFYAIAYADDKRLSGWAEDMMRRARPEFLHPMPSELVGEISDRENPCELICLVHETDDGLTAIRRRFNCTKSPLITIFDRAQNPGNLGTVIRSADAFQGTGIITTGHSADFFDPATIRSSIGTVFHMPFAALESVQQTMDFINALPVRPLVLATSAHGEKHINEVDLTGPVALLVGNETFGLSKAWKEAADLLVKIPIYGAASSLNVGCATSICLYEIARQREEKR